MGLACYVSVEGDEAAATRMDGKALALALEKLDLLAREEGLRPLEAFVGLEPGDAGLEFLADQGLLGPDCPTSSLSRWFPATEGIDAVRALIAAIRKSGLPGMDAAAEAEVLRDLEAALTVLSGAAAASRRWRLALDL